MEYDYKKAMTEDIKNWIEENAEYISDDVDPTDTEKLFEYLNEKLWTEDSVTGNASGSYTFNRNKAREYAIHNIELAAEAYEEFDNMKGFTKDIAEANWETIDVTIRCYLLSTAISAALRDLGRD